MRIVVWNCRMSLQRKLGALLKLEPDIAVVPEAGDMTSPAAAAILAERGLDYEWIGGRPTKGLGVLARGDYRIERAFDGLDDLEWILPLRVSGVKTPFTLMAVWAMNHRASNRLPGDGYLRQVDRAVHRYPDRLPPGSTVVAGDFNNAVQWDVARRAHLEGNFAVTAAHLEEIGLVSAYHTATRRAFGDEPDHTFYQRDKSGLRSYHIDYCFIPSEWGSGVEVTVGTYDDWVGSGLSDHAPLIVDVNV